MGNRRVRVMWSDLNGLSHGRYVPVRRIHEHTHHAVTTLTMNVLGDILGRYVHIENHDAEGRLQREIDDRAAVITGGRTVVPNTFTIDLSAHDFERLMEGATKVRTSEFGSYIIENMEAGVLTAAD